MKNKPYLVYHVIVLQDKTNFFVVRDCLRATKISFGNIHMTMIALLKHTRTTREYSVNTYNRKEKDVTIIDVVAFSD